MTEQSVNQQKEKLQTVSRQDMTQELVTCGQTETVLLNVNEIGFIEKGTGQHQSNTVYGTDGICPCEYSVQYKEPFKILE